MWYFFTFCGPLSNINSELFFNGLCRFFPIQKLPGVYQYLAAYIFTNMKRMIWTIGLLALLEFVNSQAITKPIMGPGGLNAYSSKAPDLFSAFNNQAALAEVKSKSVGLYGERRYLVEGLNNYLAVGSIETKSGSFGIELGYFGFSRFNQSRAGLAYALALGSRMNLGVEFNCLSINIPGYGRASTLGFELAGLFHITDKLSAGMQMSNPVGGEFGRPGKENLPSLYRGGVGYDPSRDFFAGIEIVKEELIPPYVNVGMQYGGIPGVAIRTGFTSTNNSWWMAICYLWRSLRVGISISFHPVLGITPGFFFLYQENTDQR
jgi:hypothetical protein